MHKGLEVPLRELDLLVYENELGIEKSANRTYQVLRAEYYRKAAEVSVGDLLDANQVMLTERLAGKKPHLLRFRNFGEQCLEIIAATARGIVTPEHEGKVRNVRLRVKDLGRSGYDAVRYVMCQKFLYVTTAQEFLSYAAPFLAEDDKNSEDPLENYGFVSVPKKLDDSTYRVDHATYKKVFAFLKENRLLTRV